MIKNNTTLFILFVAFCGNSMAELTLVDTKREVRDTAYAQAYAGKDVAYWMRSLPSAEDPYIESHSVAIQSFSSSGSSDQRKVELPSAPLMIFSIHRYFHTKGLLIVYADFNGKIHASQIDDSFAIVKNTVDINTLLIANEIVLMPENYVIGGIGSDDFASIVFLDKNLAHQEKIDLPIKKKGEVSSIFFDQGRLLAISSHSDATAYMHELSLSGVVRSTTQLRGGGATGIALGNRGFAVSYRVGREVFVERFDRKMKSLWVKKLHDVFGIATRKGNLNDMQNGFAWVGANNGKLTIYKLDDEGNVLHTAIDTLSGYGVPPSGFYLSIALGRDIHIRGQARKSGGPVDGSIDSFYFIDSEK